MTVVGSTLLCFNARPHDDDDKSEVVTREPTSPLSSFSFYLQVNHPQANAINTTHQVLATAHVPLDDEEQIMALFKADHGVELTLKNHSLTLRYVCAL